MFRSKNKTATNWKLTFAAIFNKTVTAEANWLIVLGAPSDTRSFGFHRFRLST